MNSCMVWFAHDIFKISWITLSTLLGESNFHSQTNYTNFQLFGADFPVMFEYTKGVTRIDFS